MHSSRGAIRACASSRPVRKWSLSLSWLTISYSWRGNAYPCISFRFTILLVALLSGAVAPMANAQSSSASYVYDAVGRLVVVYDASGNAAVYNYDLVGNLLSIANYPASQPTAFRLSSNGGQTGSTITIYGVGFCSSPIVTFNGIPATVVSSTATQIVVTVPSGATTGEIVVSCGGNTIDAGLFSTGSSLVPSVTGFSPVSGAPGTSVTIAGTNFQPNSTNVAFSSAAALITGATGTSVTAVVPSDASSGPITVFNSEGAGVSSTNFVVLPVGTVYAGQIAVDGNEAPLAFEAGSQQAALTFQGTAGEQVFISFNNFDLDCMSSASLFNPDGTTLASDSNFCNRTFLTEVLPTNGNYSIVLYDGFDPGSVSVRVQNVASLPTIAVGGPSVSAPVVDGQIGAIAFAGVAGDPVSLSAICSTELCNEISVVAPDGSILEDNENIFSLSGSEYFQSTALPTTGTYLIAFYGEVSSLQLYYAPLLTGTISVGGPTVTLTPVPGQSASLSFTGTAGQTVSFESSTVGSYCGRNVTIVNPDGSDLGGVSWECSAGAQSSYTYSTGFVLPTNGTYQLSTDFLSWNFDYPFPDPGQSFGFNLYDATPQTGTISIGGPPVSINAGPGQTDTLSFTGSAGQQMSAGLSNLIDSNGNTRLKFVNPDGTLLSYYILSPSSGGTGAFSLPSDGTYAVQIGGYEPVSATIQLYDATPVIGGSITIGGSAVTMNTNPGQPFELSFDGSAGQSVNLFVPSSTYDNLSVAVFAPDGTSLASSSFVSGSSGNYIQIQALPTTGTYTIELIGESSPGTASVLLAIPTVLNYSISVDGPAVPVTVTTPGISVSLTFNGSAGQWVRVDTSNSTLASCAEISLENPSGRSLNSTSMCDPSDAITATLLPTTGTYTIFVYLGSDTGTFDVKASSITPINGTMTIDGPPATITSSGPEQLYDFTFSGSAGQQISFVATNFPFFNNCPAYAPLVTLYDGNFSEIDDTYLDQADWPDGNANLYAGIEILPSDGTYTLILDAACGPMSVALQLFSAPTLTGTVSINGGSVNVPSNVPAQETQLTFSGTTGQSVRLTAANSTYQDGVCVWLYDPTGGYVDANCIYDPSSSAIGPKILSVDGSYSILIEPYGATGSIDIGVTSP
jgi:YD repeat-containing protein